MNLEDLLLAVSKLTPNSILEINSCESVLEHLCKDLKNQYVYWDNTSLDPLTFREFYINTDSEEKYGNSYSVIYFNDKPVAFINFYGKYQRSFLLTKINIDTCNEVEKYLKEENLRIRRVNNEYIEDDCNTIDIFLEYDDIKKLDLSKLPYELKNLYSEGDLFDIVDKLIENKVN